jgi:hypothetical protein
MTLQARKSISKLLPILLEYWGGESLRVATHLPFFVKVGVASSTDLRSCISDTSLKWRISDRRGLNGIGKAEGRT